jgi:acyl-coenzyme A synthetase/AMP-(fatty) acid ligase
MVIERDVTPERLLDLVDHGGVTMLKLVPVFYQLMAASPAFGACDLSGLRTATFGGAPTGGCIPATWLSAAREAITRSSTGRRT